MERQDFSRRSLRQTIYQCISRVALVTPEPIKNFCKKYKIVKLWRFMYDKYDSELLFQMEWANKFKENKDKVLEFWKEYRDFDNLVEICKFEEHTKVLDIGCGISTVLHYLKGEKYGLDPLADEYKKLYDYPEDIDIRQGFCENIQFSNEYFDVVISSNSLDHVSDAQKSVEEIHRVLKKGGFFLLNVTIHKEAMRNVDVGHPYNFTKNDVYSLIENKFEIIYEEVTIKMGLKNYVEGSWKKTWDDIILILKKV